MTIICSSLIIIIYIIVVAVTEATSLSPDIPSNENLDSSNQVYTIQMPNITTNEEDKYLCIDWEFPFTSEYYLVGYEAKPDNPNVHHMLLFACSGKIKDSQKPFTCTDGCPNERVYFAWGRNAPPLYLPKDVGFKLGGDRVDYLRYQVHYRTIVEKADQTSLKLTITKKPQPYSAGVILMVATQLTIPAHTKITIGNISCLYNSQVKLHPFAFRTHAHMLGRVLSAYIKKKSEWKLIGKGNPQWPQAFWPAIDKDLVVEAGDYLVAKCVYNSENWDVSVNIGATHNDEMCNFYIMYYRNSSEVSGLDYCMNDDFPELSHDSPADAIIELPLNQTLEDIGEGIKHHHIHNNLSIDSSIQVYTIQMPNITTNKEDKYLCIDWEFPFSSEYYLVGYEAKPDNPNVHHMLLFACSGKIKDSQKPFTCTDGCPDERVYFAWGRNAPPLYLPKDVGFKLGGDRVDYLRYQVHYRTIVEKADQTSLKLTITNKPQPYSAGVILMVATQLTIPPHTKITIGNISCLYNSQVKLHPFAFRTHAHMLGRVLSAYIKKKSEWKLIGKGNPQWPQAFWPAIDKDLVVEAGDYLVAKCVYNSENWDVTVNIGATHNDEMCNFYIMYYRNSSEVSGLDYCMSDDFPELSNETPADAIIELPPNPDLEDVGEGIKHHHVNGNASIGGEVIISLNPTSNWPLLPNGLQLGDVTGLATDQLGFIYLFHRGSKEWLDDSFDQDFKYKYKDQPPIQENTLLKINISTGEVVKTFGKNIFHMPHGIFVDHNGVIWLTDVAMHLVFKYPPSFEDSSETSPLLILGEKFIPGFDNSHFCKPTDVAAMPTGEVYISDGYCNSRVVAFDRFGNFLKVWMVGENKNDYYLPHSISIDTKTGTIFVADRITYSTFVYSLAGELKKKITSEEFKPELFSVAYNPSNGNLFCLNGNLIEPEKVYDLHVIVVDIDVGVILSKWSLPKFIPFHGSSHDIAVSPDGKYVFVSEVGKPGQIFKFEASASENFGLNHKSVKKGGILSYHRHLINKEPTTGTDTRSFFDDPLKQNIAAVFVVLLCFLVIPLSIIVFVALYLKRRRQNRHAYSHLEAAHQVNRRLTGKNKPASLVKNFVAGKNLEKDQVKEEELRRLESESDEEYSIPELKNNKL